MTKRRTLADNRSMDVPAQDSSRVFFFPKRNPPVSVRANTRAEAEELLDTNHQEV